MRCQSCHYSLVGLVENQCPECGRRFHRNDPRTFASADVEQWFTKAAIRPIGNWLLALALLVFIGTTNELSNPGPSLTLSFFVMVWMIILGWWCIRIVAAVTCRILTRRQLKLFSIRWMLIPALFAVDRTMVARIVRFELSKKQLTEEALRLIALQPTSPVELNHRVGHYFIRDAELLPSNAVVLHIRPRDFDERCLCLRTRRDTGSGTLRAPCERLVSRTATPPLAKT